MVNIREPSKSVTDGMDMIVPSSGVLFKKTVKAAREVTSGSDKVAAKKKVRKCLQDYKDAVYAFCGISDEEDSVLETGKKRAKTKSTDTSSSKRKAPGSTVPASGEQDKKRNRAPSSGGVGERELDKVALKLGIYVSNSSIPNGDDIEPLRSFFDEKYKGKAFEKEKKVRDMLCNFLWFGVKCITSSEFCNDHGTFVKGARLTLPRGIKDRKLRMFKMLENAFVCVSIALAHPTGMPEPGALCAVIDDKNTNALTATKKWLEFGETLKDSIKVYPDTAAKAKALEVVKEKAQESTDYFRELERDLLAAYAASEEAKKSEFDLISFPEESQNVALTMLADAALQSDQPGNSIAVAFLFVFLFLFY